MESEGYPGLVDPRERRDVVRSVHITRAILGYFNQNLTVNFIFGHSLFEIYCEYFYSSSVKRVNNTEWYLG